MNCESNYFNRFSVNYIAVHTSIIWIASQQTQKTSILKKYVILMFNFVEFEEGKKTRELPRCPFHTRSPICAC